MKKAIAVLACMMSVILCSCGNRQQNDSGIQSDKILFVARYADNYAEGRIYGGIEQGIDTPSMYIDYDTMESTVLCSKPNCNHKTNECVAKNIGTCPMLTENGIYFFKSNYEIKEEKNGKRNFNINSKLCKVSLETSEIETITNFTDCVPADTRGYVLFNNRIYFTADDMDPTFDDYGGISYSNIGGTHYFCSIDLECGEYKNYGSIYDGDKSFKSSHSSSSAMIMGVYNEKLLVNYEFCKSYDEMLAGIFTELMFEFDPETEEIKEIDITAKPYFVDADIIIYYDKDIEKTVIIDKGERTELDIYTGNSAFICNNKLFTNEKDTFELIWYDLSDMSSHRIEGYMGYRVADYFNNCYILTFGDKTVKLTEEELLGL